MFSAPPINLYIMLLYSFYYLSPLSFYASFLYLFSEFSGEEYKSTNVDPIAQFSKPVAVLTFNLVFCATLFFFLSKLQPD
jgi:hypothetical protein